MPAPAPEPDIGYRLRGILRAIRRNGLLLLGIIALSALGAFLLTGVQTPLYESEATLLIGEESESAFGGREGGQLGYDPDRLQTDLLVLGSRQIAEEVVDTLPLLFARVLEPEISIQRVIEAIRVDPIAPGFELTLQRSEGNQFEARIEDGPQSRTTILTPGVPGQIGGATITLARDLPATDLRDLRLRVLDRGSAIRDVLSQTTVWQRVPRSDVVNLLHRSTDSFLAAAVPNALAGRFIAYKRQVSETESEMAVDFLRDQVDAYSTQLTAAEEAVRRYRENEQVISLEVESEEQLSRLSQLQVARDSMRANLSSLRQLLNRAAGSERNAGEAYRQLLSYPAFFGQPTMRDLMSTMTELENERNSLLVRRTPENADIRALDRRIAEIRIQILDLATNYANSAENQIGSIESNVTELRQDLAVLPGREMLFGRLERERGALAEMYALLQQRLKENEIDAAGQRANVRILDQALVPGAPVTPNPMVNLLFGLVAGTLLAAIVLYIRMLNDGTLRSEEDVVHAAKGLPFLAPIPNLAGALGNRSRLDGLPMQRLRSRLGSGSAAAADPATTLVMLSSPSGPEAEAFRRLRTDLLVDGGPGVLVVTSPRPGDGKSTVAANLAMAFAEEGMRTVVVDGDLRNGSLHRLLEVGEDPGMYEILQRTMAPASTIQTVELGAGRSDLDVVTVGHVNGAPLTVRGRDVEEAIAELRKSHDVVIIDAPPITYFADASTLAAAADGVVLVARVGSTDRNGLDAAIAEVRSLPARFRGLIVNDVQQDQTPYVYPAALTG